MQKSFIFSTFLLYLLCFLFLATWFACQYFWDFVLSFFLLSIHSKWSRSFLSCYIASPQFIPPRLLTDLWNARIFIVYLDTPTLMLHKQLKCYMTQTEPLTPHRSALSECRFLTLINFISQTAQFRMLWPFLMPFLSFRPISDSSASSVTFISQVSRIFLRE